MTPDHFRLACRTVWGPRWQADAAIMLNLNQRSVRAFLSGEMEVPHGVRGELLDALLDKSVACLEARHKIMEEKEPEK